jgi:hypothetical protein
MYLENLIYSWIRPNMDENNKKNFTIDIVRHILSFIILVIALIVSWDCNTEVYRIILGNKCY